jgi:hypothetical protein
MSHQAPPPPATRRPQQQQTSRGGRRQQHQPQRSSSHQQPALPPPHAHHGGSRGQAVSQARLELTPLQSFSTYTPGAHAEMIYRGLASCLQFLIDDTLMTYIARAAHYTRLGQHASSTREAEHILSVSSLPHFCYRGSAESYDSARSIYSDVLAWLEDADALCPYADAPSEVAKPASTTSQAAAAMAKAKQVHQWVSDFTLASRIELRAVLQDNLAYLRELEASTCPSRQQKAPSYLTGYRTASNEQRFFPFRRHAAHPKDKSEREYYMDALRHYWGGSVWRQFNHLYEQYVKRMVGDLGTSFLEDFRRHDRKGITPEVSAKHNHRALCPPECR